MAIVKYNPILVGGAIKASCDTLTEANLLARDMDVGDLLTVGGILHYKNDVGAIVPSNALNYHRSIIPMGPWDMQTLAALTVNLSTVEPLIKSPEQIMSIYAMFRNDQKNFHYPIPAIHGSAAASSVTMQCYSLSTNNVVAVFNRYGTEFSSAIFASTAFSRGNIVVEWVDYVDGMYHNAS